jgi:hypothetical protein
MVLLLAGMLSALVVAGCGGTKRTESYFTTQPGTLASVDARLAAWQRRRVSSVADAYMRLHFGCGTQIACRLKIKGIGTNAYEATIRRHGFRDYCYRVRFFFKAHRFAGPMQPINCV